MMSTIVCYTKNRVKGGVSLQDKALVIIDIQNDITKNYKEIIGNLNDAINWAAKSNVHVIYIKHYNLSAGTRTFKPNTQGCELASDLNIVSNNIFTKSKGNVLTSEGFKNYIDKNDICEFFIAGGDAIACIKSSTYNLAKTNYKVNVLTDCITSYDKNKISEMLNYYESKGCNLLKLCDLLSS